MVLMPSRTAPLVPAGKAAGGLDPEHGNQAMIICDTVSPILCLRHIASYFGRTSPLQPAEHALVNVRHCSPEIAAEAKDDAKAEAKARATRAKASKRKRCKKRCKN